MNAFEEFMFGDKYVLRFYRVDHGLVCTINESMVAELREVEFMLRQQQAEIEALKSAKIKAYNNGVEDGRKPNTNNKPIAWDRGTWTVGETESQEFIESSDFNHDVRLYLNGDFEDNTQRLNYLKHIADRLNTHPVKELTDEEIMDELVKVKHTWVATTSVWYEFEKEELKKAIRAILRKASEK